MNRTEQKVDIDIDMIQRSPPPCHPWRLCMRVHLDVQTARALPHVWLHSDARLVHEDFGACTCGEHNGGADGDVEPYVRALVVRAASLAWIRLRGPCHTAIRTLVDSGCVWVVELPRATNAEPNCSQWRSVTVICSDSRTWRAAAPLLEWLTAWF